VILWALVKTLEGIFNPIEKDIEQLNDRLMNQISPDSHSLCIILQNIFAAGGKRLRPALSFLMFRALAETRNAIYPEAEAKLFLIAEIAELIHTASLVHDDIIDNSLVRRGAPTTNSKWSNAITVISGDFMFARAAVNLAKIDINKVVEIFASVLENLCSGEIRQVEQKYNADISFDYYYLKTYNKTASLFEASTFALTELFPLTDTEKRAIANYGKFIGMAFQIIDDILDFTSDEESLGKPAGADIREGQINLPLLFAFETLKQSNPDKCAYVKERIQQIPNEKDNLKIQKTIDDSIRIIEETAGIERSYEKAIEYVKEAVKGLSFLPESKYKNSLVELADFVIKRSN
jgi:all-trans-nonaprenyl-diphosphate synthase